ncbi:hypothetical protein BHS06_04155 [Myxococcus xanthus]|uniref:tetratricopeptide repeat protein n=1 Tax=Myxococcus xanthus TaxID=34 RepID=UPI0011631CE9|nr:tetratricopeptide repeat protein [Myxococcus xanthus]QDE88208.1 hypothetical protein BHS06_04155 [Myxococcus xanthus]
MKVSGRCSGILGLLLLTAFCVASEGAEAARAGRREDGRQPWRGPRGPEELPTTAPDIYLRNLAGQIFSLEGLLAREPGNQDVRVELSQALHMRGRYRGDLDALQRALALLDAATARAPGDARLYALRATQQLFLHRFAQAADDLARARALGASEALLAECQRELDWNQGRYQEAERAIRQAAAERPSVWTLARLARLEHDLGRDFEAEQAFARAEDLIADPNPVPVAWLNLQRGHHHLVLGDHQRAAPFFREAVRRLPGHVAALEHLAETLHLQGHDAEALTLYTQALKDTGDAPVPEVLSGMASVLLSQGKKDEAARLVERAARRYEQLLRTHPEAMAWHAAEFFLGVGGNPARAAELLRYNVTLRPSGESWAALAEALLEQGDLGGARAALDQALGTQLHSARLYDTAAELHARLGDARRSQELREGARHLRSKERP